MAKIYISSTFEDLRDYREEVYRTLRRMNHEVVAMEDYVAQDARPLDKCLGDVARCDVYLGLFAWRYGFIPKINAAERPSYVPQNCRPDQISITEHEYLYAINKGKTCLTFVMSDKHPWPPAAIEKGKGAEKINALRQRLREERVVPEFTTKENLASLVAAALTVWERESLPESRPNGTPAGGEQLFKFCDRDLQVTPFNYWFETNLEKRRGTPQVYIISGNDDERHNSLVDRIERTHIKHVAEREWGEQQGAVILKKPDWVYDDDMAMARRNLIHMLFGEFVKSPKGEVSPKDFAQLTSKLPSRLIIIRHSIDMSLHNSLTQELLRWYLSFWAEVGASPSKPQFVVFLNIIYPKVVDGSWWKPQFLISQFNKRRHERILSEISAEHDETCPCQKLKELTPVKPTHVKQWFNRYNIPQTVQEQLSELSNIFRTPEGRQAEDKCMDEVESKLESILIKEGYISP